MPVWVPEVSFPHCTPMCHVSVFSLGRDFGRAIPGWGPAATLGSAAGRHRWLFAIRRGGETVLGDWRGLEKIRGFGGK